MSKSGDSASKTYMALVTVLGLAVLLIAGFETVARGSLGGPWFLLAFLAVIAGAFPLKVPRIDCRLSAADIFIFTSCVLLGPAAGALTAALDGLAGSLRAKSRKFYRSLFNTACMAISAYAAGKAFFALLGGHPGAPGSNSAALVPAFLVLALIYHFLNTGLVSGMVALGIGRNVVRVWAENFSWLIIVNIAAASTAALVYLTSPSLAPAILATLTLVALSTYTCYQHVLSRKAGHE